MFFFSILTFKSIGQRLPKNSAATALLRAPDRSRQASPPCRCPALCQLIQRSASIPLAQGVPLREREKVSPFWRKCNCGRKRNKNSDRVFFWGGGRRGGIQCPTLKALPLQRAPAGLQKLFAPTRCKRRLRVCVYLRRGARLQPACGCRLQRKRQSASPSRASSRPERASAASQSLLGGLSALRSRAEAEARLLSLPGFLHAGSRVTPPQRVGLVFQVGVVASAPLGRLTPEG